MSAIPELLLCDVKPERTDEGKSAQLLRERAAFFSTLATSVGCQITTMDASALKWEAVGEASFQDALERAKAVWWVGQAIYMEEMELLYSRLHQHMAKLEQPPKIYESPEAVEESFNLSTQYYRLLGTDIPQAETRFCSLDFDPTEYGVDEMAQRLESALREGLDGEWEELAGEAGRVFFRTYYGTQKMSAYLHSARSLDDLIEGCTVMVEALRHQQPITGVAVRKWLPIASVVDDLLGDKFRKEYRVFAIKGKVVAWVWQPGQLMGDPKRFQKLVAAGRLDVLAPDPAMLASFAAHTAVIGRNLRSQCVAIDFAQLEDGSVALVEINPGHCAAWGHQAVMAGVYGHWMQTMLELDATPPQTHCVALDVDRWGEGIVFGF